MVDRLRILLEEPLDPRVARAIVVFSSAIPLGLAALFLLAGGGSDRETSATPAQRPRISSTLAPVDSPGDVTGRGVEQPRPARRQDPQDRKGSPAARHAARALASHRALQHVPYRDGELAITLVGARGSRALLRVSAPSVAAARRGWHRFLGRFHDPGRAYLPIFRTGGDDG